MESPDAPVDSGHHDTCDPSIESRTNITTVTWFILMVILITIALEIGTHKLNHFLNNPMWLHWKLMMERVYSELMILGFVSLTLFTLSRAHLPVLIASIYTPNAEECEHEVQELIEDAHMALFVVMLLYILAVAFVIILSRQVASGWERLEQFAQKDVTSPKGCCSWHLAKSLSRYKTIRSDFIRQHRLAPNFDFSRYLKYCIAHVCLEYLTEIKWSGWVFAAFLLLVNWGRMMILPLDAPLAIGLLVVGVAALIQIVSIIMYLHMRRIESIILKRCTPSSQRVDDDAMIAALENGGSDEKSPLLKSSAPGARIKLWSRKPKEAADPGPAKDNKKDKDKSKDKKDKKDDKKEKKDKKDPSTKNKDKKSNNKDASTPSETASSPSPSPSTATTSDSSTDEAPPIASADGRDRFKQRPVSFAIPEGAMPEILEVASKQRRVLDRKQQLSNSSSSSPSSSSSLGAASDPSSSSQLEEALAFFQSKRREDDAKLFPFSRPLLLAHLLQLVLLFQAWFTGFVIYFWIFYIPQWYFWLVASFSPVVTLLIFMPSYLPKYVVCTHVRGLSKVDYVDKAWTRQVALEKEENDASVNATEATPILHHHQHHHHHE